MEETQEQQDISRVPKQLQPHVYKKGQSGNPGGRPVGSISMKQYVKNKLLSMTDEEREEFLEGVDKRVIWEMAESKASQGIGQADDLSKLEVGVIILPKKNENTMETTTETRDSSSF